LPGDDGMTADEAILIKMHEATYKPGKAKSPKPTLGTSD
jgi:hypothetical protein